LIDHVIAGMIPPTPPPNQTRYSPFQHLLPPGMTLDAILLNTTLQYDWHKKLVETLGPEVGQQ
jgi:hypothetical protein